MNKQRYLAELQRLLVFMTDADRDETVRRYADLFDEAGPEGEAELVEKLGSPTKAAIGLSRGYEPGKPAQALPGAPERPKKPKAALTETQEDPWGDLPTFDMPDYIDELMREDEEAAKPETEKAFSMPDLPGYPVSGAGGEDQEESRGIPPVLGIPLYVIVMAGLGLPLAAVCLALAVVLLTPGGLLLYGAFLVAVGGLWCVSFMADAVLLFGAAVIVLAFGLLVLFGGLWIAVNLAKLYIGGFRWVTGELLGRRSAAYA